ncbi:hypothetical protein BsIDN1_28170 [Bacillus safensis]|uniref:Uncharacterized protein n=1 Tax=Bacillus safensis TaxID=561879 RepID=A0A5S9MB72_BACIA|nr:hypothetical protein BsIDN1_28170 [Bacillus safensis]
MEIAAILFSLFFALNIGARGQLLLWALRMDQVPFKSPFMHSVFLCSGDFLAGSVIGGGEVVKTISSGIMPESVITLEIVCIIIGSAALSLFIANLMAIPLSTSERSQ